MVDGCHPKNPFSFGLIDRNLDDDRKGLEDEDPSHDGQEDLLFGDDGHRCQGTAEREGSYVPHEYLGRIGIEPQKSQSRSHDGSAEYTQFPTPAGVGDLEVIGELNVPCQIGDKGKCSSCDHDRTNGQAIESIGEVDGIGGSDEDKQDEDDIEDLKYFYYLNKV